LDSEEVISIPIPGPVAWRTIEMLESPAYSVLSLSAHRAMSRLEIELARHPDDSGRLVCTHNDFIKYGIHHNRVALAIRELEALGFIKITRPGRGRPSLDLLTYRYVRMDA